MIEKLWYNIYSIAIKLGLIRFDQWPEDNGMWVIQPRWFWQRKKGQ